MSWTEEQKRQGLDEAQPISTSGPGATNHLVEGMPMAEYTRASLQPCLRCGRDAREGGAGTLTNIRVIELVLVADTICCDCMSEDELREYEAVRND